MSMSVSGNLSEKSLLYQKHVAIAGAGPAGLTLARLLQMQGAKVQVLELDTSPEARSQGGSLDLHEDSGQLALQKAGLEDLFHGVSRPEGQLSKVFDKHGTMHVELRAEDEQQTRPEIDRGALRDLLLGSLVPDTVVWGRTLSRVEQAENGRLRLIFKESPDLETDLLIGCDGTWSKVRPIVSDMRPHYSGVTFIETRLTSPDMHHPDVAEMVGLGNLMVLGDNKALMAQRNGDGHIRIYVALRVPEDWTQQCGLDFGQPSQARAGLLNLFEGWDTKLTEMLRASDDLFLPRPLFTFPPEQTWHPQPNVTLLGDAAHVMPPFTGKGANFAMLDAVELADCLLSGQFADVAKALRAYEIKMLARMSDAISETLAAQELMIAANAPEGLEAHVQSHLKE